MFSTTFIQDFFDFPEDVVGISNQVEWHKGKYGYSPGVRSNPLEESFPVLCKYITARILSQYYDLNEINYGLNTFTHFNLVPVKHGTGITHRDDTTLTCIIFLSKNQTGCGTQILKRNQFIIPHEGEIQDQRKEHFKTDEQTSEWIKNRDYYNSHFTELARVNSVFNSAIVFDGHDNHSMFIGENVAAEQDRLTLIQFIDKTIVPDGPALRFSKSRVKFGI